MYSLFKKYRKSPTLENTVWYFGCSKTWGEAVEECQTAPYFLSKYTNLPVDNLGIVGGSPDLIYFQIQKLIQTHTPRCIIIQWPNTSRTFEIIDDTIILLGMWSSTRGHWTKEVYPELTKNYEKRLLDGEIESYNNYCISNIRNLVNCPVIDFTYENLLDGRGNLDHGTDNMHPGPLSHLRVAELLSPRLEFELTSKHQATRRRIVSLL